MNSSNKSFEMYCYIRENDTAIKNINNSSIFAPFPEKAKKNIAKRYDSKLPFDNAIAFYDTSVFKNAKSGIVFLEDGFYHKFMGIPRYIAYSDISRMVIGKNGLEIKAKNIEYTLIDSFDYNVLKRVITELIRINKSYGETLSTESKKITEKGVASKVGKVAKGTVKVAGKVVVAIIDDMLETAGSTKSAQERVRKTSNNPGNTEKEKIRNEIIVIQLKLKEAQNKIRINDAKLNIKQEQMKNLTEKDNNEEVTRLNDEIGEIRKKNEKLCNTVSHLESQMELLQERLDKIEDEN